MVYKRKVESKCNCESFNGGNVVHCNKYEVVASALKWLLMLIAIFIYCLVGEFGSVRVVWYR